MVKSLLPPPPPPPIFGVTMVKIGTVGRYAFEGKHTNLNLINEIPETVMVNAQIAEFPDASLKV